MPENLDVAEVCHFDIGAGIGSVMRLYAENFLMVDVEVGRGGGKKDDRRIRDVGSIGSGLVELITPKRDSTWRS